MCMYVLLPFFLSKHCYMSRENNKTEAKQTHRYHQHWCQADPWVPSTLEPRRPMGTTHTGAKQTHRYHPHWSQEDPWVPPTLEPSRPTGTTHTGAKKTHGCHQHCSMQCTLTGVQPTSHRSRHSGGLYQSDTLEVCECDLSHCRHLLWKWFRHSGGFYAFSLTHSEGLYESEFVITQVETMNTEALFLGPASHTADCGCIRWLDVQAPEKTVGLNLILDHTHRTNSTPLKIWGQVE